MCMRHTWEGLGMGEEWDMRRLTHVIPSTFRVVVAMCAVGAASDVSLEGT